jgi:hypothetical protein
MIITNGTEVKLVLWRMRTPNINGSWRHQRMENPQAKWFYQMGKGRSTTGVNTTNWQIGLEDWKCLPTRAAHLFILIYSVPFYIWTILKGIMNYIYIILKIFKEIIIYIISIDINTRYIYMRSIKIIKTEQKYIKQWRSNLARLNQKIKEHMLESYKVIDYEVRKPSQRSNIIWRPYGYHKWRRSTIARRWCIKYIQRLHKTIELRSATKKSKPIMHIDTGSYDILVENCCSQSITNNLQDYIKPPMLSDMIIKVLWKYHTD